VSGVLGWDADAVRREVEGYAERVQAERRSQDLPDDAASEAARLVAPESRQGMRRVTATR
jgi:glycerol-3-phosphate dehydrogenase